MLFTTKQKSEYTFKYNRNLGRHGWLRLTPAYGVKLVENLLASVDEDAIIFDPFSGTATTGLVAAQQGKQALALDVNPFLVWLGNAKCQNYSEGYLTEIRQQAKQAIKDYKEFINQEHWIPQIFNIERWWSKQTLKLLAALRAALVNYCGEPDDNNNSLVWIAFCRLIIESSSATFNHVSMSFTETVPQLPIDFFEELFGKILDCILKTANEQIQGDLKVIQKDARHITSLNSLQVDRVITSPPYPNRMSYMRELRPYMYWTKFLHDAKEAGEIDWISIGGTWGVATSRLASWKMGTEELPEQVFSTVEKIKTADGKNARIMATYVLKYFYDIHLHLSSLKNVLRDGAKLHYVVGNSSFFGEMVDTATLISKSMQMLGYKQVQSEIIRKRNCNKALYEYCVSATWQN